MTALMIDNRAPGCPAYKSLRPVRRSTGRSDVRPFFPVLPEKPPPHCEEAVSFVPHCVCLLFSSAPVAGAMQHVTA